MTQRDVNDRKIDLVHQYVGSKKRADNLVVDVEPVRLIERASIQQGLFLFPLNAYASFMGNVFGTFGIVKKDHDTAMANPISSEEVLPDHLQSASVVKLILPVGCHETALHDLQEMNITTATLFPGLDGFARSLKIRLRIRVDDDWEKHWSEFLDRDRRKPNP
jgi:hypothetical protein